VILPEVWHMHHLNKKVLGALESNCYVLPLECQIRDFNKISSLLFLKHYFNHGLLWFPTRGFLERILVILYLFHCADTTVNLTCPHCLQHFFFDHLFHLYIRRFTGILIIAPALPRSKMFLTLITAFEIIYHQWRLGHIYYDIVSQMDTYFVN